MSDPIKPAELDTVNNSHDGAVRSPKPEVAEGDRSNCSTPNSAKDCPEPENNHCAVKADDSPAVESTEGDSDKVCDDSKGECSNNVSIGLRHKDDSGISLSKSPGCDHSCLDDSGVSNNSICGDPSSELKCSDTQTINSGACAGESPTAHQVPGQASDAEELTAEKDADSGEPTGSHDITKTDNDAMNDSEMKVSSADEAEDGAESVPPRRRPRSRPRVISSSSDSSSTSGPDNLEDVEPHDADSDDGAVYEPDKPPPRDSWQPLFEIRRRETGCGNHINSSHHFRRRAGASINLVKRLKLYKELEHHDGCVNSLHFNQTGTLLASGSDDLNIVVWKWLEGKPFFVFDSGHRSNVFQSKFMPYSGDTHIVSCARDGQVRLAELSSTGVCKGTRKLAQHRGAAHKLSLLQDSSHVFYCCGEDAVAFSIDLREEKPNKMCIAKEGERKVALYSIHANPFKSHEFCVGGRDHFIRIYDKRKIDQANSDGSLKKFCPHHLLNSDVKANVTCAVYNYNGTEIIGTYNDEDIYMFNAEHSEGSEYIHKYSGHRNNATVKGVNFYGPRSEFVISGSDCGNVFLWEKESEQIVQYFHADEGGVINVLEPHPHAPILATSGLDHEVKVWVPLAEEPTGLQGLKRTIRRNRRDRDDDRRDEPEMIDGQMLWFLMQQLHRRHRGGRGEDDDDPPMADSDSDSDSAEDEDGPGSEQMQCVPS